MAGLGRTIPALPVRDVPAAVAHRRDGVTATDFGTRELPTVDLDGNLLTFFRWQRG